MKKYFIFTFIVLISIFTLSCTPNSKDTISNELNKSTLENEFFENKDGILTVCFINYPPFEYVENGKLTGPGYDMIVEAFKRADIEIQVEILPWARILEFVELGKKDVIVDAYKSSERAEFLDFSSTIYVSYPEVLYVRKNSNITFDGTSESLKGLKIGANRDFYHGELFEEALKNNLIELEEIHEPKINFEKLLNNRIDAVIETIPLGEQLLKEMNLEDEIIALSPALQDNYSYLGFSKKNNLKPIIEKYDEAIKSMEEDGTIDKIFESYDLSNPRKRKIESLTQ